MDKYFPDPISSHGQAASRAALRLELQQEASLPASRSRSPGWPLIAATLALLGMLLLFHYVVREAVRQSESRHKEIALNAEAIWRCNHLQGRELSRTCLLQVNAEARKAALLHAQNSR